ncbi:aldose 1-epimerase [Flagellimonas sp.]|uniref:aldose 1-epimerase n=1 Tax=Flagellimonas sp. TaxID=2058762 RepID=UPI003F4A5780
MEKLILGNQSVRIDAGELVGFEVDGHEFIHQKGSPGWSSADTEMFPIIGPVAKANYTVKTPKGNGVLDQHGHMRLMNYGLLSSSETQAAYRKAYTADTPIRNRKFPEKSDVEYLTWPYTFEFEKSYTLTPRGLEITFTINGDQGMPFMLGYHPAFKLHADNPIIVAGDRQITLDEVLAVGSRALQVADCTSIILKDEKKITVSTEGFGHFMCWTEVRNMVCIEPVSFYPYAVEEKDLHKGFQQLNGEAHFKVLISVGS